MKGKPIPETQISLYWQYRNEGDTQVVAAAKSNISLRSAKRMKKKLNGPQKESKQSTVIDPLRDVWNNILIPLLEKEPKLQAKTLLEELQNQFPNLYPDSILRTLQRRVKEWKALHGPEKDVIFRQEHPPGLQGISDFTNCNDLNVSIQGQPFLHLLYHFALAFSKWEHAKVILGGESFTALAEGLQTALTELGGVPKTHRTDSLSAAYKNLQKDAADDFTKAYKELCAHYGMQATRNNKGISHENGTIESLNNHLKQKIDQALMLRNSRDFDSVADYELFVAEIIARRNARRGKDIQEERKHLMPLPLNKTRDFDVEFVKINTSSTFILRAVYYSVPSKLIGMKLKIHVYDARLECFLGANHIITLERKRREVNKKRPRTIDYRHIVNSLMRKPQAFRYYIFKEDLFPTSIFKKTWEALDKNLDSRVACKEFVKILKLTADSGKESEISNYLEMILEKKQLPTICELEKFLGITWKRHSEVHVNISEPNSYDQLLK